MVAINFTVFQDKILSGEKRQTIRKAARCKPGDRLQLYTGMRTKQCRKLGDAVCMDVVGIGLSRSHLEFHEHGSVEIPSERMIARDIARPVKLFDVDNIMPHEFAQIDGFSNLDDMLNFFDRNYGLPFEGVVITWRDFVPAEAPNVHV
jgi:hypothetical protein